MLTQHEAQEALTKAIVDHAVANGMANPQHELIGDYAVIACWQLVEDDRKSRYTIHFSQETIPDHIAKGLFGTGSDIASSGWAHEDTP